MENIIKYITNLEKNNKTIVDLPHSYAEKGELDIQIWPNKNVEDQIKRFGNDFDIIPWNKIYMYYDNYHKYYPVICAILIEASEIYSKLLRKIKKD
jgi:hypothetical protein